MKIIPQGSFPQNEKEVVELLKRKYESGKLSHVGKCFVEQATPVPPQSTTTTR